MPDLTLKLLGSFQLIAGGVPVTLTRQARLQSLLAYLALHHDAPQPRHYLAYLFWPDATEAQARASLRQALFELRRAAPALERCLHIDGATLQWQKDGCAEVDAVVFEGRLAQAMQIGRTPAAAASLEQAVALYTGDLLPACYDDWVLRERERLRQLYLDALEQLVQHRERSRDYTAAVSAAQQLLAADPLQETAYRTLMRLHLLNGDRARALRAYHTCVTMLQQELDVTPSPETQAEYQRLLRLDAAPAPQPAPAPPASKAELPLIGRRHEWEALQDAWRTAGHGQPHLVLIGGEAGIGKTRLAEELLAWVEHQGYAVARTRSYAAEGRLAYAPVAEWLRADALRSRLASLDDVWTAEVARILPELLAGRPDLPAPQPMLESWQRQRFRDALARAVRTVEGPLLLVIDDLQWCDQETLEWLHYLLRTPSPAPLLVVGTVRREEVDAGHPLAALEADLHQEGRLLGLELGPLDAEETATLAAQAAGHTLSTAQSAALHAQSAGYPLFVVETVRAQLEKAGSDPAAGVALPRKVQAVLHARLAQLSPAAHELAKLAAVVGRAFTLNLLAQAGAGDEDALVRGLDELWQRRIVREVEAARYDFSHDLLRDAAYAEIGPAQRRLLHRKVAQALEAVYAGALESVLGELAAHYAQAGLIEPALRWYQQAATAAKRLYAHAEAVSYLERALDVVQAGPDRARRAETEIDLLHSLGYARIITDGWGSEPVGAAWEQALTLARQVGRPFQLCRSLYVYSNYLRNHGEWRLGAQYGEESLRFAEEHDVADRYLMACIVRGQINDHYHVGRFAQALELCHALALLLTDQPLERSFEWFSEARPEPDQVKAMALWHLGHADQARAICRAALEYGSSQAKEADRPEFATDFAPYQFALMMYVDLRDLEQVRALSERLVELSTRAGYAHFLRIGRIHMGHCLARQGQLSIGLSLVRDNVEVHSKLGLRMFEPYYRSLLAETLALASETRQALSVVEQALAFATSVDNVYWNAHLLRLKGDLLHTLHAPDPEVEHWYREALDLAQSQGSRALALRAAMALANLWQSQGQHQDAHDLLAPLYSGFTEGFDTPDLVDAKALLAALA